MSKYNRVMVSRIKGWFGEVLVVIGMWLFMDRKTYLRFHDVIVPAKNGTTQIDHIWVSKYGVFVVETKNMKGWIFGDENQSQWTQVLFRKKYKFQNPLRQNYRHIMCLAEYLEQDAAIFHSVVLFVGGCNLKTEMPDNVMKTGVRSFFHGFTDEILSEDQVQEIAEAIRKLKSDESLNHKQHLKSLKQRYESETTCPKCGEALVERTAGKGRNAGNKFLGCSSYPRCGFTKAIDHSQE